MPHRLKVPIRSDKFSLDIEVIAHLAHRETEFQTIDIYDTVCFGRVLTLDGHIQLTELDEHAYHEALVHVPTSNIEQITKALVVGGGDGGVVRELVRYESIERIDMVEIDAGVIEESKLHLPFLSQDAFKDRRLNLSIEDAFPFVRNSQDQYDLIVVDSTDTYEDEEGEISEMLFTEGFYRDISRILSPQGFVVTQSDNPIFCPYSVEETVKLLQSVFPFVSVYHAIVPSFGGLSAYVAASHTRPLAESWPGSSLPLRYLNEATYAYALQGHGFQPRS